MLIDVTVQSNGFDMRAKGQQVYLQPGVQEARYNTRKGAVDIVRGGRDKIAAALRAAGYEVSWVDPNPARVLGAMTSSAKADAARKNGAKNKGRKRAAKPAAARG